MRHSIGTLLTTVATVSALVLFTFFALTRPSLISGPSEQSRELELGSETGDAQSTRAPKETAPLPASADGAGRADPATLRGIDVSHYQGRVDWQKVAASGVRFAYMKATAGHTYVDARFAFNKTASMAAGLYVGAYHFFIPNRDPLQQAEHFLRTVEVAPGMLPPALDLEKHMKTSGDTSLADKALIWLKRVENATGCRPIVYASRSFWEDYLGEPLAGYPLWLAEYGKFAVLPKGAKAWAFWQRSQTGRVDGIEGHVDLDLFAGGEDSLKVLLCNHGADQ
ncbi:MAG: GH25 family lysozyme [Pseudomonadota bacterium]